MREVTLVEVGLRDGLQNESCILSTADKKQLTEGLIAAGVKELEITSFVHPRWIPQLSDAAELACSLPDRSDVRYRALVPNRKGLERALETPVDEFAVFLSASETHNRKNINKGIRETYPVLEEVVQVALAQGKRVRGYVSTVFGCPYEGEVPVANTVEICEALLKMGVYEISLGDTIGVATPRQVKEKLKALTKVIPVDRLAGHFHDTSGTALANAYVSLEIGMTTLDSSFGGLGGCPYAPGAVGNVATEDLVYLLEGEGIATGIDLDALCEVGWLAEKLLGQRLPSKMLRRMAAHVQAKEESRE